MQRKAIEKLSDFVSFLKKNNLDDREKFRNFENVSNKEILSKYFGLTKNEFDSESGDKLYNYLRISFSNDKKYVSFNYADNFFFNSINKEIVHKPRWSLQLRMSRGITFDLTTGELVSFPYEKFFNVGEYIDGEISNISKKMTSQSFIASEKMDGILIHAFYDKYNDKIRFGTRSQLDPDKKGFIDTSEKLMKKTGKYNEFKNFLKNGKSVMLELIDPKFRVVVGYGNKSALFLHGIRDLKNLEVENFKTTQKLAADFNLSYPSYKEFSSFEELMDFKKNFKEDLEGFVVRFEDGSMIKFKTDSYFNKLLGLRYLNYKNIGESILNKEDWNKFKYEKIKSEELFEIADKYRSNLLSVSDIYHNIIIDFVNRFLGSISETSSKINYNDVLNDFNFLYTNLVREGVIDSEKVTLNDFKPAVFNLIKYKTTSNDKYKEIYNKKLMKVVVLALKSDKWMGSKLQEEEIIRSLNEFDLIK
jgi:RNA ligase